MARTTKAAASKATLSTLTLNGETIIIEAFHNTLFDALIVKQGADLSAKEALHAIVKARYASLPSYNAWDHDRKALKALCGDNATRAKYQMEQYAGAIMALFKDLPKAMTP